MKIIVNVKPNSFEEGIEKVKEGEYLIKVKEKAERGKANIALIKLLSKKFGVDWRRIKIVIVMEFNIRTFKIPSLNTENCIGYFSLFSQFFVCTIANE